MSKKKRRMATVTDVKDSPQEGSWMKAVLFCSFILVCVVSGIHYKQSLINVWNNAQIIDINFNDSDDFRLPSEASSSAHAWQVALQKETEFVSELELEKYLKKRLNSSFFSLGVEDALTVLQEHPWIKLASARKVWPNTLLVEIDEHQPWLNLNRQELISSEGVIFKPDNIEEFIALPILEGTFGEIDDLLDMYDFFSKQMPSNAYRIATMRFKSDNGWTLKLENNVELYLGKQELTERLDRFFSIADKIMSGQSSNNNSNKSVAYVDLRYQTGIAVGWHKEKTSEQVAQR